MSDYPLEKWIPVLLERTADLTDQVAILYSVLNRTEAWKSLPEETRAEIEDKYFTYRCGFAYSESRKSAEKAGKLDEFDRNREQQYENRMRYIREMLADD